MSSPTLREVIARAIYEEPSKYGTPQESQWDNLGGQFRDGWFADADRVIAAIQSECAAGNEGVLLFLKAEAAKHELAALGFRNSPGFPDGSDRPAHCAYEPCKGLKLGFCDCAP